MPTAAWTEKEIIHLLNRAGFGASELEIEVCLSYGKEETVNRLITGTPLTIQQAPLSKLQDIILDGKNLTVESLADQQCYWFYRMLNTGAPLIEKMALFWHDHFATSINKVGKATLMARQIDLFREHALGSFHDLLLAVGNDPAMMIWLDAAQNRKGSPNENYAREVMELFTLGRGNYTEPDVREAARSFTGWRYDSKNDQVIFDQKQHDDGQKTVLGKQGNFDAEDMTDLLLSQESYYTFIATKLLQTFVHETPSAFWIDRTVAQFKKSHSIGDVLSSIFLSNEFYQESLRHCIIKSPVDYVVTIIKALDLPLSKSLANFTKSMGQELFNPPNVSGWEGDSSWLMTSYMLSRHQFAEWASKSVDKDWFNVNISNTGKISIEDRIKRWSTLLSIDPISEVTLKGLVQFGEKSLVQTNGNLRLALQLLLMSPECQLK
ncbi:DUF1800 family protein [Paenibacillus sp. SI8]|uniref:DUF1800 domain-containing protein n=1 Tax=unclassified Paenibacillus TaxID=185978 RepID=UPI003466B88B